MRGDVLTPATAAPLVFTEEWLAPLHRRFSGKHPYQTSYVYGLATRSDAAARRNEIETLVAQLPQRDRGMLIPKLRSNENHHETYHELVLGALLAQARFSASYEELIGGLTPDWVVRDDGGRLLMVVEVLTANQSESQADLQRAVSEILARLQEIPFGLALGIRTKASDPPTDQCDLKQIELGVRKWLAAGSPPVGASICVGGVTLVAIAQDLGWTGVQCIGPATAFRVDCVGLAKKISNKVKKYSSAVSALRLPLVVAVIADAATGHDVETVDNVLNGHPTYECRFDKVSGENLGTHFVGRNDALFQLTPGLSAVFSAWRVGDAWQLVVHRNPAASYPLVWESPAEWTLKSGG
jgi:hypothetical protein